MIFLKPQAMRAQTSIEFLVTVISLMLVVFMGCRILLQGFATLMATRWASTHSRCLIIENDASTCENKTQYGLRKYFGFKNTTIATKQIRGIIRTEIRAQQFGFWTINASYDLEPSEYKRISHEQ